MIFSDQWGPLVPPLFFGRLLADIGLSSTNIDRFSANRSLHLYSFVIRSQKKGGGEKGIDVGTLHPFQFSMCSLLACEVLTYPILWQLGSSSRNAEGEDPGVIS